eukprot:TRINITY_DN19766_c0_g1_i1.p1 TRINITY_DN19766_c0_g1~~TRINITY_DN19766_c0_g1_i1.p1  ORF type:complete len:400 (+),score=50.96 TRINITY_DN19766_c0_g1_i1:94-1293(+)
MTRIRLAMAVVILIGIISTLLSTIELKRKSDQQSDTTNLITVEGTTDSAGSTISTIISIDNDVHQTGSIGQTRRDCPDRYLYFGNVNGRHSNQIRSVIHALHFGKITNRTVIIPPFKQDKKTYLIDELYNYTSLSSTFCVAGERDVFTGDRTAVGCLERDGIPSKIVRQPKGGIYCNEKVKMGKSRAIEDFKREAAQLSSSKILYMFETSYYKNLGSGCFWKNVGPSDAISNEVSDVMKYFSPAASIHLRGLEKSCVDRLKKMMKKSGITNTETTQCDPSVQYVKSALEEASVSPERHLYLADDLQRPGLTQSLKSELKAVSYSDYPSRVYKSGLYAMLIDFWVLVSTEIFLPNQASSLSTNAHYARIFRNYTKFTHGSYNWIPLKPDADPYTLELCVG